MKKYFGILFLTFSIFPALPAQDSVYSKLRTEASMLFNNRNYESALPKFRELLYRFEKEPEYQYGTAVCLTKLNMHPEEAILLLRSVNTSGYNPMSWYYLGVLLHRQYLFDDAIHAYSRFMLLGKAADIKVLDVNRQIEMAKNGMEYTRVSVNFRVQEKKTIQKEQLEKASEINGSGKMVKKPIEFCSKNDLREGYRPLMYLPVYTEMNEYVFVSGYEKSKKNGRQIYRVRNINHETWGVPEPLNGPVNTLYDDEFPFFDARTSILYFSSKGHSSMGGYDIFKSAYDWNSKTWSKPENLGFPINSPYDDYMYMTDEFSQTVSFVSNRNTPPGTVTLYKIKMLHDTGTIRLVTIDEIQSASEMSIEPVTPPVLPVYVETSEESLKTVAKERQSAPKSDYNKILADALNLQLRSDSLGRIARDKRIMARETPDEDMKKQLVTDIIILDKESKKLQREADMKFTEARSIKGQGAYVTADTLKSEIREDTLAEIMPVRMDEFGLLEKSPYGPSNPIPKGIITYNGLVYRIQLGVFSKPKPDDAFGGINPVCFEEINNTSVLKYYTGLFYSLNGVSRGLEQVKKNGFPDAFIVAFLDGKPITTERAKEIEFEELKL